MTIDDIQNKDIGYAKSKRRICDDYNPNPNVDLTDRIDCLQRALAHERGENQKFRDEVRTLLQRQLALLGGLS